MGNEHFAGMTLNERLLEMQMLDAFDAAARARDRVRMVDLLRWVTLDTEDADTIVDVILHDPGKYAF